VVDGVTVVGVDPTGDGCALVVERWSRW
jgi:hypothetical protein